VGPRDKRRRTLEHFPTRLRQRQIVIAGLDPAIHLLRKSLLRK
jgi:hypothetical protein